MRTALARLLGLLAAFVLRALGRAGTTVPGRVALAADPNFTADRRARIDGPVAVVSATNGKTTTSALIAAALGRDFSVVGNFEGANMAGGIASSLIRFPARDELAGLFEVDEFWLGDVATDLSPDIVLLGNLFRDQLDRYGELDTILERWHEAVGGLHAGGSAFVACADDPGIAWVLRDLPDEAVTWFGCTAGSVDLGRLPHAADSDACRRCGEPLEYSAVYLGHLGDWSCSSCGLQRPTLDFELTAFTPRGAKAIAIDLKGPDGLRSLSLPLPGLYNAYNAISAWAVCSRLGLDPNSTAQAFSSTAAAFGRGEHFSLSGTDVQMLLVKNPTGANEVIRALADEPEGLTLQFILNDQIADGRDVSWIWDTDVDVLVPRIGRLICSGHRADEAALRFKYAGLPPERITVVDDPRLGLETAASTAEEVWVLPTYTAMLALRSGLTSEGVVEKVV